ncbi:WD-40 repeat family protein [Musa troglodytarum]|uniref:WD-40 repeat family protein n=1 Tax=Musa troglodytarum TaxID=320322 RepID=A0A9E7EPC0_9LILI|nr:WD-40 repeat family protein [Musa troglodytarum]
MADRGPHCGQSLRVLGEEAGGTGMMGAGQMQELAGTLKNMDGDGDSLNHAVAEEAEAEAEEEEEFYESLDRILSSSCSSTSASDDDADEVRSRRPSPPPPPSLPSLDVWTSEPASVAERRRRLLQRLGLAGDPALARLAAASDGPVHSSSVDTPDPPHLPRQHQHQRSINLLASRKLPLSSRSWPSSAVNVRLSGGDDHRCLIKNLDNGREFVVEEFGQDGMWNKLREVGTGRQLTMEEFDMCVEGSPIVQELMRRQKVEATGQHGGSGGGPRADGASKGGTRSKKIGSWLRRISNVAGATIAGRHHQDRRSGDEKDTSSENGGRRSSSATDHSQDGPHGLDLRVKAWQYGKSHKELSGLYMSQAIQAHNGSIWSIKFSLDGRYLASAGEDCVIHVWGVSEISTKGDSLRVAEENGNSKPFALPICNRPPDPTSVLPGAERSHWDKKMIAKFHGGRKSVMMPEYVFALSEKPVCSFRGHADDVLDLSWSKSQYLLSSSMDKTVRLWHMSSNSCLKIFTHSDYVTCIQFNPIDDRYFISGSLDEKVRIWSIPDPQVVDWNDLHEMVTAACFSPDGQAAMVGSHKGSCYLYDTSDNRLVEKRLIDLENKKKKVRHKKITGFQFAPGSSSKVLVTSADSRVRIIANEELIHKFKGFRNTSSQISAYWTANGKYVICASEDSHVYVWRYDNQSQPSRSKTPASVTQSYEYFHCQGVTMAIPWPSTGTERMNRAHSSEQPVLNEESDANGHHLSSSHGYLTIGCQQSNNILTTNSSHSSDRVSATWPEELMAFRPSPQSDGDLFGSCMPRQNTSAWGLVIVTASQCGEIRTFQNFSFRFLT